MVREFSVAPGPAIPEGSNLTGMVFDNARTHPGAVLFAHRAGDGWQEVTAARFAEEVTRVAGGLVAAGVRPGDRVALMSATRYEWTLLDYAIWAAGAVTVPVYHTAGPDQAGWILSDSGASAAVVETAAHRDIVDGLRAGLPALGPVWQIDRGAVDMLGGQHTSGHGEEVSRRRAALRADDVASLIYTSGTTGRPKGCVITHRNLLTQVHALLPGLRRTVNERARTLLFLPLAHVYARVVQCGAVYSRCRLGYTSDPTTLAADLREFRPTFLLCVPHVLVGLQRTARRAAQRRGRGRLFDLAERVAVAHSQSLDRGGPDPLLRLRHRVLDTLVYRRVRAGLGGRCRLAICGGAPLDTRLAHFYRGAGITVYEGYGLTEVTGAACANREDALRIGTVGRPVPGVSVRLADDGEVLIAGDTVFQGYWNDEAATADRLVDGWMHTGDLGALDPDGFLTLTGRRHDLLVTAGGENVVPGPLEDRVRAHPLVRHAVVVGDRRPFVGCLVTLDRESLSGWLAERGLAPDAPVADLRDHPELRAEVRAAVDHANRTVSRAASIRRFRILPTDLTVAGGELTPTGKVRRDVVLDRYSEEVSALYGRPARPGRAPPGPTPAGQQ